MSRFNENPLLPASLAANGRQGAGAEPLGPYDAEHSPLASQVRAGALCAIHAAREYLDCYAHATDAPEAGVVDAADLLDAAAKCLAVADDSDSIARARKGAA